MRFQTKYDNYVITLKPKMVVRSVDGRIVHRNDAVRCVFGGPANVFDSKEAQRLYGWTDEERIDVEKNLLSRNTFGSDFFIAVGEKIPEYLYEWLEEHNIPLNINFFTRCGRVWIEGEDVKQCENRAVPGKDFCEDHLPKAASQGLGTTASARSR